MILHLGVLDVPYQLPPPTGKRRRKITAGTQTTGDVAGWLEDKYHLFENFYQLHQEDIAGDLEHSLAGTLENLLLGAPAADPSQAFASATSQIEDRFKRFLSEKEMEKLGYPGVPTQAALRGVSHRFAHPYAKRAPRPSFIDTGLLQASMKSWID